MRRQPGKVAVQRFKTVHLNMDDLTLALDPSLRAEDRVEACDRAVSLEDLGRQDEVGMPASPSRVMRTPPHVVAGLWRRKTRPAIFTNPSAHVHLSEGVPRTRALMLGRLR